jgi:tRNA nucleotidyltransferase (CCA-adding enzyme)
MRTLGITERYFPELHALIGVPQDPKWHPEGDVWVHTMHSLDSMARGWKMEDGRWRMKKEKERLKLLFAVLCHDFGKPLTTTIEFENSQVVSWQEYMERNRSISEEMHTNTIHYSLFTTHLVKRIRALGHEEAGLEPTRTFMYRLTSEHDFIESTLPLVEYHLKPSQFYKQGAKAAAIRRLATKVNIEELVLVAKADFLGRTTEEAKRGMYAAGEWLLEKARALKVENRPLECLVQGRDLIALGLKPSPEFKMILNDVYELQLEGRFENKEEVLSYIDERYIPIQIPK